MSKENVQLFQYLQFVNNGNDYKIKLVNMASGEVLIAPLATVLRYRKNGQLFNKKLGNDFDLDLMHYSEAKIFYNNCINERFKIKHKNDAIYTAKFHHQICKASTIALRKFFPELL